MISLVDKKMKINDIIYPIIDFEVWFSTPRGLCTSIDEAIGVANELGVDPELNIKAFPVAISDTEGVYEAI